MRETTSLGGERAHQRCLFSPLPTVFSRALFSTLSPLFGETSACDGSQDFLRKTLFIPVLRSIVETYRARPCPKGDGEEGKWGTGGENPEGEGGLQQCCTPLPWGCLPKTAVERSCVTGTVSHKDRHPPANNKNPPPLPGTADFPYSRYPCCRRLSITSPSTAQLVADTECSR